MCTTYVYLFLSLYKYGTPYTKGVQFAMEAPIIILGVIILFIIFSGIKIVNQQTVMIVETLGKFSRVLRPGLNIIIPIIQKVRSTVSLFGQNYDFQILAITSDKVTITLDTTLIYHIKPDKIEESYYSLADPASVMRTTIENSIRSYVALQTHEEILQKRDELTQYLIDHLREKFETWGREIDAFQIKDVVLPREITEAMSKVIASKRLQEAAEFEANANKILKVKAAEADREARKLSGLGVAEEREAIVNGLKLSIENMKEVTGGESESVMNVVMLTQYMDMLKSVGTTSNSKVIFMNSNPGTLDDLTKQMFSMMGEKEGN
jgi:regulator of protease activity HflC (stomatin/prohibitin superfamily)